MYLINFTLLLIVVLLLTTITVSSQRQQQQKRGRREPTKEELEQQFQKLQRNSPNYTKLMPSVQHLTADMYFNGKYKSSPSSNNKKMELPDMFASDDQMRLVFSGFCPIVIFMHVPYHPSYVDGLLYKEIEELAQRIGSFVAIKAVNADENPHVAIEGFRARGIPSIRYYPQGSVKRMKNYTLPRARPRTPNSALLSADEMEDYILKNAVTRKNLTNAVIFDEDFNDDFDYDEVFYHHHEDQKTSQDSGEMEPDDDENENEQEEQNELQELVERQQQRTKILNKFASKMSKKYVMVMKIQYPANPSAAYMFADSDAIERKVKRLESWFLLGSAHVYAQNNVGFALIKEKMPSFASSFETERDYEILDGNYSSLINEQNSNKKSNKKNSPSSSFYRYANYKIDESIRVTMYRHYYYDHSEDENITSEKIEDIDQEGEDLLEEQMKQLRGGTSPFYGEETKEEKKNGIKHQVIFSLEDLTSTSSSTSATTKNKNKISKRVNPVPLPWGIDDWMDFNSLLMLLFTPPIPPPTRRGIADATTGGRRNSEKPVEVYRGVTYRHAFDECTTLRECMERSKKLYSGKFVKDDEVGDKVKQDLPEPFIVRGSKEFKESITLDELIKIYNSSEAEAFKLNGALPNGLYREYSIKTITQQWLLQDDHPSKICDNDEIEEGDDDNEKESMKHNNNNNKNFFFNIFQSHVVQEKFPYKLPKEFEEFAVPADEEDKTFLEERNEMKKKKNSENEDDDPEENKRFIDAYRLRYGRRHKNCVLRLSPQFCYRGSYTGLHFDPSRQGGGFMHLLSGRKIWEFVHPRHLVTARKSMELMGERNWNYPDQFFDKNQNEKEVLYAEIGPGDTVIFPPGWLHRVWTLEKTIGFVGYVLLQGAEGSRDYSVKKEAEIEEFKRQLNDELRNKN